MALVANTHTPVTAEGFFPMCFDLTRDLDAFSAAFKVGVCLSFFCVCVCARARVHARLLHRCRGPLASLLLA